MRSFSALGALLIATLLAGTPAGAESLMTFHLEKPIRLEADELQADYGTERYEAIGAASLRQDGLTMDADRVWFDKRTGEAGANGHVRMVDESGTITGDELLIRVEEQTARLRQAKAKLAGQGFQLAGSEIAKLDENRYRITDGSFTACDGDPPAWKFGASEVNVELGGYARAKHMFFYVHDIPVFYLPYFLYPVKTERESGLLIPRVGYSQLRGAELFLSYYQVLGRNMDATLFLDSYSHAGIGKGLEYRYLFGDDNAGEAYGYHVSGFGEQRDVYAGHWRHSGTLPGKIQLRSDLEYVSDHEYLTNFATAAQDYNRDLVTSHLYLARAWGKTDLSAQGEYLKDFSETATSDPVSRLPEVHLAVIRQRVAESPLYLRFDAEGNNLRQGSETVGQNLRLRPAAQIVLRPVSGISLTGEAGYQTLLTRTDGTTDRIGFFDFSAQLASRIQRTFTLTDEKGPLLRHSIEPEIGYLRTLDQGQESFPQLLPEEATRPIERVTFALGNRFSTKTTDSSGFSQVHERLWLRLSSGYVLQNETSTEGKTFIPLRSELTLRPADWFSLLGDARYGLAVGERHWQTIATGLRLTDARRDEFGLDYYYNAEDSGEYLAGRLAAPLTDHVKIGYQGRYSIEGDRSLEHLVDLEYHGQCWSITLSYRNRPDEQEYMVNFSLAGLDSSSGFFNSSAPSTTP